MVIAVPVIVKVATRTGPVFGATANWTMPPPAPDAPWVTVRKLALLVAVHVQVFDVDTEIEADPPEAANVVVVTPVMIWQPDGPVVEFESLPQAMAPTSNATAGIMASFRKKRWALIMPDYASTYQSSITPAVP
jgi:hypothetical protein